MRYIAVLMLTAALVAVPRIVGAEQSQSASQAKKLCELMTAAHLDAIAAQDPDNPSQFVAAMVYPTQLLVISARYEHPEALQPLLEAKKYREIYSDLQSAAGFSNQVFFIDMQADGLSDGRGGSVDVMYEGGSKQTVFDDDWRKQHGIGEREFLDKYRAADTLYESLLKTLTGAASPMATQ